MQQSRSSQGWSANEALSCRLRPNEVDWRSAGWDRPPQQIGWHAWVISAFASIENIARSSTARWASRLPRMIPGPFEDDCTFPDSTDCKFCFRFRKVVICLNQLMNALT
jgi:hypothetical protein